MVEGLLHLGSVKKVKDGVFLLSCSSCERSSLRVPVAHQANVNLCEVAAQEQTWVAVMRTGFKKENKANRYLHGADYVLGRVVSVSQLFSQSCCTLMK